MRGALILNLEIKIIIENKNNIKKISKKMEIIIQIHTNLI